MRGVRKSSGDVGDEGEREDVEDDTVMVPTRRVMSCCFSIRRSSIIYVALIFI